MITGRRSVITDVIAYKKNGTMVPNGILSRLRFSLRTLLTATLLAAICLSYLAKQDAERRQLISEIELVGGSVKFDESIKMSLFKSQTVTAVTIPHDRIAGVGPLRLRSFPNLSTIGLKDFKFESNSGNDRIQCSELRLTTQNRNVWKTLDSLSTNREMR